jgi:hypothetical protein
MLRKIPDSEHESSYLESRSGFLYLLMMTFSGGRCVHFLHSSKKLVSYSRMLSRVMIVLNY